MKLAKNKKGIGTFLLMIVISLIIILIYANIKILKLGEPVSDEQEDKEYILSSHGLQFIQKTQELEKHLFYLDQKSKFEIYKSIHQLGNTCGFEGVSKCGHYGGYNKLTDNTKECYPDYKLSLAELVKKNLASVNSNPKLPTAYFVSVEPAADKTKVSANTNKVISLSMPKGTYKYAPSFEHTINYKITDYSIAIAKTKILIDNCSSKSPKKPNTNQKSPLLECVETKIKEFPGWQLAEDPTPGDRILKFDITSANKIPIYNPATAKVEFKQPVMKCAIDISLVPEKQPK